MEEERTSAIIIWQSKVPLPIFSVGFATCPRIVVTTGAPKVIFGTKCPSYVCQMEMRGIGIHAHTMMSTCNLRKTC